MTFVSVRKIESESTSQESRANIVRDHVVQCMSNTRSSLTGAWEVTEMGLRRSKVAAWRGRVTGGDGYGLSCRGWSPMIGGGRDSLPK